MRPQLGNPFLCGIHLAKWQASENAPCLRKRRLARMGRRATEAGHTGGCMNAHSYLGIAFIMGLAAIANSQTSLAQSYPSRPIQLVNSSAEGGAGDFVARLLADKLARPLGQPVSTDNRPGASGITAAQSVARAAPDGYTLLVGHTAELAILQSLVKDLVTIRKKTSNRSHSWRYFRCPCCEEHGSARHDPGHASSIPLLRRRFGVCILRAGHAWLSGWRIAWTQDWEPPDARAVRRWRSSHREPAAGTCGFLLFLIGCSNAAS